MDPSHPRTLTAIAASPTGRVWAGTSDGFAVPVLPASGKPIAVFEAASVSRLWLSADDTLILAGALDGLVSVHDVASGHRIAGFRSPHQVTRAAMLRPGQYLTVDVRRNGMLWTPRDSGLVSSPVARFSDFAILPGGVRLALVRSLECSIWDLPASAVVSGFEAADGAQLIYENGTAGLSRDGRLFFLYWDRYQIFDSLTGELRRSHPLSGEAVSAALSNDGEWLIAGDTRGRVAFIGADGVLRTEFQSAEDEILSTGISDDGSVAVWMSLDGRAGVLGSSGAEALSPNDVAAMITRF